VPSGVLERGLLLKLRFAFEHAVNLRPVKLYPGVATPLDGVRPEDIDMVVIREGTEGPYAASGARCAKAVHTRSRSRRASTRGSASSGSCATRSDERSRDPGTS